MQLIARPGQWADQSQHWPSQIREVVCAAESQHSPASERRRWDRFRYRVRALLHLEDEAPAFNPRILFTRDVNQHSLGFVTWHRLAVGKHGSIHLPLDGEELHPVDCCIMRCRDFVDGWYEGAVFFLDEQEIFSALNLRA